MASYKSSNPGIRRSQIITTFGPGSIVDLQHTSVMIAGTSLWPESAISIHEPVLERYLRVNEFRMPATGRGRDLPAVIFPQWYVCPTCYRLAPYRYYTMGGNHRDGNPVKCPDCFKRVYPARLIVACKHGHIEDFPWEAWAHREDDRGVCGRPELYLRPMGFTSSLADLRLECKACGAKTTMAGATVVENLNFATCSGNRPWLMQPAPCNEQPVPLQRGASNVYFGVHASTLSIPPWSRGIFQKLDRDWHYLKGLDDEASLRLLIGTMELPKRLDLSPEDTVKVIRQRQAFERGESEELSEKQILYNECMAIHHGTEEADPDSEFTATPAKIAPELEPYFQRAVLVERLREVRALVGFNRVEPSDPSNRQNPALAPLSSPRLDWLPAVEIRGEGIYLQLDEARLARWSDIDMNAGAVKRADTLNDAYLKMCKRRNWQPERVITPRFLLVHTLTHAVILQLALESGYASASLRERLYVFEPDQDSGDPGIAGFLIYTATPDSEGSLGGLVRQGQPERLADSVLSAIQEASWCSSDPLCIESQGQGLDATSLAACHSCLLISETSCAQFNRYLDRAMLIGTLEDPSIGYFAQRWDM